MDPGSHFSASPHHRPTPPSNLVDGEFSLWQSSIDLFEPSP
jgi:hypothetical protein